MHALVLNEPLLIPFLIYVSETMIWKENERSRIMAEQMGNLRGLLGSRRMYKVLNVREGRKRWTKGLMKVFSGGSAILLKW